MSRAVFPRLMARIAASAVTPGVASWVTPGVTAGLTRGAALVLAMLALSACSAGSMGGAGASSGAVGPSGTAAEGRTDLATQQACRQRVNEMYEVRNRSDIYAANPAENSPSSAYSLAGVPSRGLSDQFAYGRSVAECERNAGTGAQRVDTPPPPPLPPAAKGR